MGVKELSYGCEKKVKPWARGTKRPRCHTERAARSPGPLFDANGDGRTARPVGKIAHRHAVSFRRQTREKRQHLSLIHIYSLYFSQSRNNAAKTFDKDTEMHYFAENTKAAVPLEEQPNAHGR